jgi:hypothetical protein
MRTFRHLRSLFQSVTTLTLAASAGSIACGGETNAGPKELSRDLYTVDVCDEGGRYNSVSGLEPETPVDYIELREHQDPTTPEPGGTTTTPVAVRLIESSGTACATATDKAKCTTALADLRSKGPGLKSTCGNCPRTIRHFVFTRGDEVGMLESEGALTKFLGVVDSPKEAALLATVGTRRSVVCDGRKNVRAVANGFRVLTQTGGGCNSGFEQSVEVSSDGQAKEVESIQTSQGGGCVEGRLTDGLECAPLRSPRTAGEWFAKMAWNEASAVLAFERMKRELEAHGAPRELIKRAGRSARDETRHTTVACALAERFATVAELPRSVDLPVRDLEAIAIENAVEGCVRETYAAVVARYQAASATDSAVGRAMRIVAEDETRHAALSWDLAEWLESKLDVAACARVAEARAEAVKELARDAKQTVAHDVRTAVGLPDAAAGALLYEELVARLWS